MKLSLNSTISVLLLLASAASVAFAQIDTDFCKLDIYPPPLPSDPKPPVFAVNSSYQARFEQNSDLLAETTVTTEYYDGAMNVGVSVLEFANISVRTYAYYDTDELLIVQGYQCSTKKLSQDFELTDFLVVPGPNNTEKIASLITLILADPISINLVFAGASFIRGIPVNKFVTCLYNPKKQMTERVTLSIISTNSTTPNNNWKPAHFTGNSTLEVPVEMVIESKIKTSGQQDVKTYSISDWRSYLPKENDEEEHLVPRGVFCPGRQTTRDVPSVANVYAWQSEMITEFDQEYVRSLYEEYDYTQRLFKQVYVTTDNRSIRLIYDFNTGVKFEYDRKTGGCQKKQITNIDYPAEELEENGLLGMRNVSSFLNFDTGNFQYTGTRQVAGVYTDVWIGQKEKNGVLVNVEWYFLAEKMNRYDYPVPILMKLTSLEKPSMIMIDVSDLFVFNYRTSNVFLWNFDLTMCYGLSERKSFLVQLAPSSLEQVGIIRSNRDAFVEQFTKEIEKIAQVSVLRVSDTSVVFNDEDGILNIYFNVFERAKDYGNVAVPELDVFLKDAVQKLEQYFSDLEKNTFQIVFRNQLNGKVVTIDGSNAVLTESLGAVSREEISAGVLTLSALFSMTIGALIGILAITMQKYKKINLPFL